MEKRLLGRTGEALSVIGFGGILVMNEEPSEAGRLVGEAIERGINYFDVAPSYGNAQERLGPALSPYRQSVFLACKTTKRTKQEAGDELHESLRLLRTDHVDLYQFHAVSTMAEVEQIVGAGGALETFVEAREKGLLRYIGFSAHSEEAGMALLDRFPFDSALFPINWVAWHQGHFGPRLVDKAKKHGAGILALKTLAMRPVAAGEERPREKCWYAPVASYAEAERGVRFTLSRPVTAALTPGHADLFRWACQAAERFSPLSPEEEATIAQESAVWKPLFPLSA